MDWNRFGVIATVLGTSVSSIALIIAVTRLKPLPATLLGLIFTIVITMVIYKIIPGNVINVDVKLIKAIQIIIEPEPEEDIAEEVKSSFINHYTVLQKIFRGFSELRKTKDWKIPLNDRMNLREYFEKSGEYTVGAKLGEIYYEALIKLELILESLWVQVNMIGFLHNQAGKYASGRKNLEDAEKKLGEIWEKRGNKPRKIKKQLEGINTRLKDKYKLLLEKNDSRYRIERILHLKKRYQGVPLKSLIECIFYCKRYLGISHQRDSPPDLVEAERLFREAEEILKYLEYDNENDKDYRKLNVKIQVNLGNVLHSRGKAQKAIGNKKLSISMQKEALKKFTNAIEIFAGMGNMKRVASENLHIVEVLLHLPEDSKYREIETHLKNAESTVNEIEWKEGQARTYKYYSLYYEQKGDKTESYLKEKKRFLQNALDYAIKSLDLYKQIKKNNEIKKLDPRIKEIEQKLSQ